MEAGVRSDIAIKLYGDDLEVLREKAQHRQSRGEGPGPPTFAGACGRTPVSAHPRAARRHRTAWLDAQDVLNTVERSEERSRSSRRRNRRFALQVRFAPNHRATVESVQNLLVGDSEGHFIPLAQLADIFEERDPHRLVARMRSGESALKSTCVGGTLRDLSPRRDGCWRQVKIREGYTLDWGGKFETTGKRRPQARHHHSDCVAAHLRAAVLQLFTPCRRQCSSS